MTEQTASKMHAGDVFFGGDYAELIASGRAEVPDEAKEGPYALGKMIMVHRDSLAVDYRLPDLTEWFPARVCLPPPVPGQWYRWYDPFIWYETDGPIHNPTEHSPQNMSPVGNLWNANYRPEDLRWACPIDVWKAAQS